MYVKSPRGRRSMVSLDNQGRRSVKWPIWAIGMSIGQVGIWDSYNKLKFNVDKV